MKRRSWIQGCVAAALPAWAVEPAEPALTLFLDPDDPTRSVGVLPGGTTFPVGFGRKGIRPAGTSFIGGFSLLGTFEVNAILAIDRFEMTEALVAESGKSRQWLAENLFRNMSSIDFDGDGRGGEYGNAFLGLAPLESEAKQPFHFGEYRGVFRWYSYAIHGTQDEERIGRKITGGCINVGARDLAILVAKLKLGDIVRVVAAER